MNDDDLWRSLKELRPIDRKASDQVLMAIKNERLRQRRLSGIRSRLLTFAAAVALAVMILPKNSPLNTDKDLIETNEAYIFYQEASQAW